MRRSFRDVGELSELTFEGLFFLGSGIWDVFPVLARLSQPLKRFQIEEIQTPRTTNTSLIAVNSSLQSYRVAFGIIFNSLFSFFLFPFSFFLFSFSFFFFLFCFPHGWHLYCMPFLTIWVFFSLSVSLSLALSLFPGRTGSCFLYCDRFGIFIKAFWLFLFLFFLSIPHVVPSSIPFSPHSPFPFRYLQQIPQVPATRQAR